MKTPQILLGIALLIGFFSSYLASLSWADLTFVLPATSIGNVIVALLAHFWKHEHISPDALARNSADHRRQWASLHAGPSYTEFPRPHEALEAETEPG